MQSEPVIADPVVTDDRGGVWRGGRYHTKAQLADPDYVAQWNALIDRSLEDIGPPRCAHAE